MTDRWVAAPPKRSHMSTGRGNDRAKTKSQSKCKKGMNEKKKKNMEDSVAIKEINPRL